jgi:hypothetical protein
MRSAMVVGGRGSAVEGAAEWGRVTCTALPHSSAAFQPHPSTPCNRATRPTCRPPSRRSSWRGSTRCKCGTGRRWWGDGGGCRAAHGCWFGVPMLWGAAAARRRGGRMPPAGRRRPIGRPIAAAAAATAVVDPAYAAAADQGEVRGADRRPVRAPTDPPFLFSACACTTPSSSAASGTASTRSAAATWSRPRSGEEREGRVG